MQENLAVIVIDVGQNIKIPKSAQKIGGVPMLNHVVRTVSTLLPQKIVVISSTEISKECTNYLKEVAGDKLEIIMQQGQTRTKQAIEAALTYIPNDTDNILILHSNTPLIRENSLRKVIKILHSARSYEILPVAVILGFCLASVELYNKLIFEEYKKEIVLANTNNSSTEQNSNLFCGNTIVIHYEILKFLMQHTTENDRHYLVNLAATASTKGLPRYYVQAPEDEAMIINSYSDLAIAELRFQKIMREESIKVGVQLIAPDTVQFSYDTTVQSNAIIHPYVVFGKRVFIEKGVEIKSFVHLENIHIKENSIVESFAFATANNIISSNLSLNVKSHSANSAKSSEVHPSIINKESGTSG
jgi:bifunctional UDP-N-acetylglucosamine pyrophosphorylase/glucosamine-1-phosphate N-acetyltransferase